PGNTAAILLPSVGCPMGCNFCSTSALFGGKGNFVNFYETGDELFAVMCELEEKLKVRSFFTMDENFLLHRKRALRLLELMEQNNKSWALFVFSSAGVLQSYTMEQLVGLGISWVWMGLEGEESTYQKLKNVDTRSLVASLQSHGIRVLGSSIIGLETHRPETMDRVIDYAISHNTDFHQFMLYTPIPGTPLHEQHRRDGTLLPEEEFSPADAHGQYRFNYRHRHITGGREEEILIDAFRRDFEENGPSLARLIRTFLAGWQRYRSHPDRRIRNRLAWEVRPLRTSYAGAVWAMRKWYRSDKKTAKALDSLLRDMYATFGVITRIAAPLMGRYAYAALKREEKRLARGWTYEPTSFYEKNDAAIALEKADPGRSGFKTPHVEWVTREHVPFPGR
ncbi:MAG: B12-binding domain-containing radical SAM protein, partial [Deltaproteobacteria bacterium]|nr:B12-binding domain-containing radical SAM protein [Deltaproteobacteria bacterium]